MMMPNEESLRTNIDDFGSSRLLHDIEEISKALYLHEGPPTTSTRDKYMKDDLLLNGKKSSIWKWKPLKALTHIRNHRLTCSFFLHIHSIEGLPLNFNDLNLCVYWKRKHEVLKSQSIRVKEGVALFDETLIHHCSVYVSKHDPHNDVAKYAPKLSLLYASIVGANLDIGKHWVDLTRLLPLTLTELEDDKNRYGKWITSFKLTGKAKGATINVSFGFSLMPDNLIKHKSNSRRETHISNLSFDMSEPSIGLLYELLEESKTSYSKESKVTSNEVYVYDDEFTVIDKGIEFEVSNSVEDSCVETINVADLFDDEVCDDIETEIGFDESNEELEMFLQNLSVSEKLEADLSFLENEYCGRGKMVKSRSLDDLTNTVIDDFMNLVGFDSEPEQEPEPEPESPRERLLKQFEKETLNAGNFLFNINVNGDQNNPSNIFDSSFLFRKSEIKRDSQAGPSLISRRKARMVENLETETLMEKWGLNERAFQNSPRTDSGAFGSPVYLSPETTRELPSLGDGVGPFMRTESGGFLRSMNPLLFKRAKNGEKLVVQVSNTVVLPSSLGCDGMGILVNLANLGPEKMLSQVTRLMPLEVITGMTLQQAAWKGEPQMAVFEREDALLHELNTIETQTNICCDIDSQYVPLNNIITSTIDKIQYLLLEGLRIQSRISTEEPPSTINSTSITNNNIEEIIETSIPLDNWIKNLGKSANNSCGYFGNFTLAMQILLRDPLRDYEPVGIPMLALLQVERSADVDQMVKVNEVYVTGLKAKLHKKQQSGARWLYSSGMTGKTKRHPLTKSTALVKSSMNKMKHDETLWSISSYIHGEVDKWKELSGLKLYARNPDITFK